jgi:hypothetical protein
MNLRLMRCLVSRLNPLYLVVIALFAAVPFLAEFSPIPAARAQDSKTLAERLGYAPDAKLLIVHADDLAVAHSVDAASTKALETGVGFVGQHHGPLSMAHRNRRICATASAGRPRLAPDLDQRMGSVSMGTGGASRTGYVIDRPRRIPFSYRKRGCQEHQPQGS